MNCIENLPTDPKFKWNANDGINLFYDVGNPHCYVKIKIKYLGLDIFGNPTKSTHSKFEEWLENEKMSRNMTFVFEIPKTLKLLQYSFIKIKEITNKIIQISKNYIGSDTSLNHSNIA